MASVRSDIPQLGLPIQTIVRGFHHWRDLPRVGFAGLTVPTEVLALLLAAMTGDEVAFLALQDWLLEHGGRDAGV